MTTTTVFQIPELPKQPILFKGTQPQDFNTFVTKWKGETPQWRDKVLVHTRKSLCNFININGAHLGYNANIPLHELPSTDVRRVKGWSNSQLHRIKNKVFDLPNTIPPRAFVFGSCFHEMLLEPQQFDMREFCLRPSECNVMHEMYNAVQADKQIARLIQKGSKEVDHKWSLVPWKRKHPFFQQRAKGKADVVLPNLIIDFKTTAASTEEEFIKAAQNYDYDRQATMYIDGFKRDNFLIIAVQKCKPYNIFYLEIKKGDDSYDMGTKKINFLIKKGLEFGYSFPNS